MAAPTVTDLVPDIRLSDDPSEAERRLFENFQILRNFFLTGATGTFSSGGHTLTITQGLITNIS